ncbi:MAG: hypothetical protein U0575_02930 [Phycisphaerales bacterium]
MRRSGPLATGAIAAALLLVASGCYTHVISEEGPSTATNQTIYQPNVAEPGDRDSWGPTVGAGSQGIDWSD